MSSECSPFGCSFILNSFTIWLGRVANVLGRWRVVVHPGKVRTIIGHLEIHKDGDGDPLRVTKTVTGIMSATVCEKNDGKILPNYE